MRPDEGCRAGGRLLLRVKHLLDWIVAAVALVILSPLLLGIALWILVESGRPVLLSQERAGKDGRPFRMLKFRTMVPDAIAVGRDLGLEDPYGIVPGDPRITRSGRFLRRTGLDELPQLWNVVRGEMSLVGPRPDLVEQASRYSEEDRIRLSMRPGITGWSQVRGRDEIPWPVRFRHDAWYVQNWSFVLDAKILARTFVHFARPEPTPIEDRMNISRAQRKQSAIAEVAADEWDATLAELGHADAYLLRGYVEAACLIEAGRPTLLRAGDTVLACSVRHVAGSELEDVTTPYGYGGPFGAAKGFWPAYEDWCAERAIVSTFVRFHPLACNHRGAPDTMALERLADTIAWGLEGVDPFESMHRHHRRLVGKAEDRLRVGVEEGPATLAGFASLYEETMRQRGADDFYLFPPEYWETLLAGLGDRVVLFEALDEEGVVASILCLATPPWLHYHLGASTERARSSGATHLLMLAAARWGHEHGLAQLHLGGGVGGARDSLWEFKQRFAPGGEREMWIGKLVHDERAYADLCETTAVDGWFPAYRAPSAVAGLPVR
jgi:lipopolysaccharide/colanic/teichoic acid biosynthesis glycosyltransferase